MKKFVLYTAFAALGLIGTTSCSDFGDVNTDPEHLNDGNINYGMLFTNAQHQALGSDWDVWRNGIIYGASMIQHVTSAQWSQIFYVWDSGYNAAYWDSMYKGDRAAARDISIALQNWEGDDRFATDYQMARIVKAYIFHRLTDLYGDIPYSEAVCGIDYPKYDTQEAIYADLLKELNEAQAALDGAAPAELGSKDIYFNSDLTKWRKFANSLMLRIAMRMSKVNPAEAEKWVKVAVNNGIIDNVADNAILQHTEGDVNNDSSEPYAKVYVGVGDQGKWFLSEFFVDLLKKTNVGTTRLRSHSLLHRALPNHRGHPGLPA